MHYVVFHAIFPSDTGFCCAATHGVSSEISYAYQEPWPVPAADDEPKKRAVFEELFAHAGYGPSLKLEPGDTVEFCAEGDDDDTCGHGFAPWCHPEKSK